MGWRRAAVLPAAPASSSSGAAVSRPPAVRALPDADLPLRPDGDRVVVVGPAPASAAARGATVTARAADVIPGSSGARNRDDVDTSSSALAASMEERKPVATRRRQARSRRPQAQGTLSAPK